MAAEKITATIAVMQLGTLLAVFVYFASDILSITNAFIRDHWNLLTKKRRMRFSGTHGVRPIWLSEEAWLGWLIILGSIPIGTIGLIFKEVIESSVTKNLWLIGRDADIGRRSFGNCGDGRKQAQELKDFE